MEDDDGQIPLCSACNGDGMVVYTPIDPRQPPRPVKCPRCNGDCFEPRNHERAPHDYTPD